MQTSNIVNTLNFAVSNKEIKSQFPEDDTVYYQTVLLLKMTGNYTYTQYMKTNIE
jgi:hypothetical protein